MKAVEEDGDFSTTFRTTGEVHQTFKARELMDQIAQAAWECADPGLQFDTTINDWHTSSNTDRIYSSNPCSEYLFLDNSACNLSSLNLVHYIDEDGTFQVDKFRHAVRVMTTAMEIIVGFASYPTEPIAKNSHDYRPLGIGYANLGTLLMLEGLPYDSDEGRAWAASITAIEHAQAYLTSAEIAGSIGPFAGFAANREPMLKVMRMHRDASYQIPRGKAPDYMVDAAQKVHDDMVALGEKNGYRNAQATNIAPTGTIGLLMDCATTGCEPDFALVKFKKLAGGGFFKIINEAVPGALHRLGYSDTDIDSIITYAVGTGTLNGAPHINPDSLREKGLKDAEIASVEALMKSTFDLNHSFNVMSLGEDAMKRLDIPKSEYDDLNFNFLKRIGFTQQQIDEATDVICGRMTIEGAKELNPEHLPIFDCANRCGKYGTRFIEPMGHVKLMAAIQPFISGAISKTVNMPNDVTVEDVKDVYMQSWKMGLKALALYRDGSKGSQPLSTSAKAKSDDKADDKEVVEVTKVVYKAERRRLPIDRQSITHKFSIAGHDGYLTVGMYEDGKPGELFVRMAKTGSTINGLLDSWATMTSIALQYGVPIDVVINKFSHQRFEPAGFTQNPNIRVAKSIMDYIARWLGMRFLNAESQALVGLNATVSTDQLSLPTTIKTETVATDIKDDEEENSAFPKPDETDDAPACPECGGMTTRSGTCYKCMNCGSTTGCS
jgi:ribonucleoside-diphosphate reductase alpha chain